jgi:hypothetical protein
LKEILVLKIGNTACEKQNGGRFIEFGKFSEEISSHILHSTHPFSTKLQ